MSTHNDNKIPSLFGELISQEMLNPSDTPIGHIITAAANGSDIISEAVAHQRHDELLGDFSSAPKLSLDEMKAGDEKLVPDNCSPQEDFDNIFGEFLLGSTIKERAFYRIWRIRNVNGYMNIVGRDGTTYDSFGQMVQDLASEDALGVGRQIIYDRMKLYDQMQWMGMNDGEIISKLSARPSLYLRVFGKVIDWNNAEKKPVSLSIPNSDTMTEDEQKQAMLALVSRVETFPRQLEAIRYVQQEVMNLPQVNIYMEDDAIVLDYESTSVDSSGVAHIDDYGVVKFYPDNEVPEWVLNILAKKMK